MICVILDGIVVVLILTFPVFANKFLLGNAVKWEKL